MGVADAANLHCENAELGAQERMANATNVWGDVAMTAIRNEAETVVVPAKAAAAAVERSVVPYGMSLNVR